MSRLSIAGIAKKEGRYFLARRNPGTTIGESWEFPGGKAEPGESVAQAVVREYQEEFCLSVTPGEILWEGSFSNGPKDYRLVAVEVVFKGAPRLIEHQAIGWFFPEEMEGLPMADSDRQIVRFLLDRD